MASSGDSVLPLVDIDADGSQAQLIIPPRCPADSVKAELWLGVLTEAQVELTEPVVNAVNGLIENYEESPHEQRRIVARATRPQEGKDGRLEWLVKSAHQQASDESEDEDDGQRQPSSESHYERCAYIMVKTGDEVAKITDPTAGMAGRDVRGETIAAKPGKAIDLKHDESIARVANGILVAQQEGVLWRSADKVTINNVIIVDEYVDFSTGNIDFNGDVIVRNGVRDCFVIKADGNVEVTGLIEAATIECRGNLITLGGFAGREVGTAMVGGDLIGRYLDNINGKVEGNLCVEKEVINCNFQIEGDIRSPRGAIIGGRFVVSGAVEVGTLGSLAEVVTEVVIGIVPNLEPYLVELQSLVDKANAERKKMAAEQQTLNRYADRLSASDQKRQTQITFQMQALQEAQDKTQAVYNALAREIDAQRTIDVRVNSIIYAGVILNICGRVYQINNDVKGPLQIQLDQNGEMIYRKDSSPPVALTQIASVQVMAA